MAGSKNYLYYDTCQIPLCGDFLEDDLRIKNQYIKLHD